MHTIVLDRGHHGKARDERGARNGALIEEVLVREYLRHTEDRLRDLGHRPVIQSSHPGKGYTERWERADKYSPSAYVQCHINAGGGNYGLVGHDHRSTKGPELAAHIVGALHAECPELARCMTQPCHPKPHWTKRMYAVISGVRAVAVVYEPGFIDTDAHHTMWTPEGLRRVGVALADGIHSYLTAP